MRSSENDFFRSPGPLGLGPDIFRWGGMFHVNGCAPHGMASLRVGKGTFDALGEGFGTPGKVQSSYRPSGDAP